MIIEGDSPQSGSADDAALSLEDGAEAMEGVLFGSPAKEQPKEAESQTKEESVTEPEAEAEDEVELDLGEEDEGEAEEAPQTEYGSGKFASDDAKVTMPDGSVISVAELKSGHMFQSTFTRKTTELAREREAFEQDRRQIAEYAQELARQREIVAQFAEKVLPKAPPKEMFDEDPLKYLQAKENYEQEMANFQRMMQFAQYEQQRQQGETQAQFRARLQAEQERMLQAIPQLKDQKAFEQFRNDVISIGAEAYGFQPEELVSVADHRAIMVLRDAIAYRKALAKQKAQAKAQPSQQAERSPRIQPKQRMNPKARTAQEYDVAMERLRKTGSIYDAAKALEKFF